MIGLKRRIKKIYNAFIPKALVLMYHRISITETDLWELSVSPENFEQHLQVLSRSYKVVHLSEIIQQIHNKKILPNCIAISFDDGYVDNFVNAKPILEKYNTPATFFVTSANLDKKVEYWWDELENIILNTAVLPQKISLQINQEEFLFDVGEEAVLSNSIAARHAKTKAFEPQTLRSELYFRLWQLLLYMTGSQQVQAMQQIREYLNIKKSQRPAYYSMSSDQVSILANNDLFRIGGHTESHPALSAHSKEFQHREILNNKNYLQNLIRKPVELFAYPFGNFNDMTIDVLKEMNFKGAFTTKARSVQKKDDLFKVGRFQVNNWQGDAFLKRVSTWLQ